MNKAKRRGLMDLARTTNFILITDKEATIYFDGRPEDFDNVLDIAMKRAAIVKFQDMLEKTLKKFDNRLEKLHGKGTATNKKAKRIKVQG